MELPSPANLFGSLLFGIIGFSVYRYGKNTDSFKRMLVGVALMVYPYFIDETWLIYAIGLGLCGSLFVIHD